MLITKQKKVFQLKHVNEEEGTGRVYKTLAMLKSGNRNITSSEIWEVIEYDLVRAGTIKAKDIDNRIAHLKNRKQV